MTNKTKKFAGRGFATRFKKLLKDADAQDLAEKLDTSTSAFRQWINGYTLPTCENLYKLSEYFGCTTDYLLGLDNKKNKAAFDITNQALIDLEKLMSQIDDPESAIKDSVMIIGSLVQILTPYRDKKQPYRFEEYNHLFVNRFTVALMTMAAASLSTANLIKKDNITSNDFLDYRLSFENCMKDSLLAISQFSNILMDIAAEYSLCVANDNDKAMIANIRENYVRISYLDNCAEQTSKYVEQMMKNLQNASKTEGE